MFEIIFSIAMMTPLHVDQEVLSLMWENKDCRNQIILSADGRFVFSNHDGIQAFDSRTGEVVWRSNLGQSVEMIENNDRSCLILHLKSKQKIHHVKLDTGQILKTYDCPGDICLIGGAQAKDGSIYVVPNPAINRSEPLPSGKLIAVLDIKWRGVRRFSPGDKDLEKLIPLSDLDRSFVNPTYRDKFEILAATTNKLFFVARRHIGVLDFETGEIKNTGRLYYNGYTPNGISRRKNKINFISFKPGTFPLKSLSQNTGNLECVVGEREL